MSLVFDIDNPTLEHLGELYLWSAIDDEVETRVIQDTTLEYPFNYFWKWKDLKLHEFYTSYAYEDDEGIPKVKFSLEPFVTDYLLENEDFLIFVELIELVFTDIKSVAHVFDRLADINSAPEIFAPKLGALLNYRYGITLDTDILRDVIKHLLVIYEHKGTDEDILRAADYGSNPDWVGGEFFLPGAKVNERTSYLEYPVEHLFSHDISTHSETDRYQESTKYRDGVIVIKLLTLNDDVKKALREVIPAGIKVYFDIISDFSGGVESGDGPSETERNGIVPFGNWFIYLAKRYIIDYFMRMDEADIYGSAPFDDTYEVYDHVFSGQAIYFFERAIGFTNVASFIPIYVKDYFGNLKLDYLPEEIPPLPPGTVEPTPQLQHPLFNYMPFQSYDPWNRPVEEQVESVKNLPKIKIRNRKIYYNNILNVSEFEDEESDPLLLNKDFIWGDTPYSSEYNLAVIIPNKDELATLIDEAKSLLLDVYITDDTTELRSGDKYVSVANGDILKEALEEAEEVYRMSLSQSRVDLVATVLQESIGLFLTQIQIYYESEVPPDNPEEPIEPFKYSFIDDTFTWQESLFDEEEGKPTVDKDALREMINEAKRILQLAIPTDDPIRLPSGTSWVPTKYYDDLNSYLEESKQILVTETQQNIVDKHVRVLRRKIDDFRDNVNVYISDTEFPDDIESMSIDYTMSSSKFSGFEIIPLYFDELEAQLEIALDLLSEVYPETTIRDWEKGDKWVPDDIYQMLDELVKRIEGLLDEIEYQSEIDSLAKELRYFIERFSNEIMVVPGIPEIRPYPTPGPEELPAYNVDFIYDYDASYSAESETITTPPNKDELKSVIDEANELMRDTFITDDPTLLNNGDPYVDVATGQDFRQDIKHAEEVYDSPSTQLEVDVEVTELRRALEEFKKKIQHYYIEVEPEPYAYSSLDDTFIWNISYYNEIAGEPEINREELRVAIESAKLALQQAIPTDDPIRLANGTPWIPLRYYDALSEYLEECKEVYVSSNIQVEIDRHTKELQRLIAEFRNNIQIYLTDIEFPTDIESLSVDHVFDESERSGYEIIPLDFSKLREAIEAAYAAMEGVTPAPNDEELEEGDRWVLDTLYDALLGMIYDSEKFATTAETQSQIDRQTKLLTDLIEEFKANIKTVPHRPEIRPYPTPGPSDLESYNVDFIYDDSSYDEVSGPPILYYDRLDELIQEAKDLLARVLPTEDPTYFSRGTEWIEPEYYDELLDELLNGENVRENAEWQYEINDAVKSLKDAIEKFKEKIKLHDPPILALGQYHLEQDLKIGRRKQKSEYYSLLDYIDYRYPFEIDFKFTDVFIKPYFISIPSYWEAEKGSEIFKFSPYTEDPIHNIDYQHPDYEVRILWKGMPDYSEDAEFSGRYRFDGENNVTEQEYPVETVDPQDDYYPVEAVSDLYVNQWIGNPLVLMKYDGIHTARDSYYKPIHLFEPDDLVEIDGQAIPFKTLTSENVRDYSENGMLKLTYSNDCYLDYTLPFEVETIKD